MTNLDRNITSRALKQFIPQAKLKLLEAHLQTGAFPVESFTGLINPTGRVASSAIRSPSTAHPFSGRDSTGSSHTMTKAYKNPSCEIPPYRPKPHWNTEMLLRSPELLHI